MLAALVSSQLLPAQTPPNAPSKVDANQVYAKLCAGCHGADAHGTQQGPGLSGNLRLRRRSASRLRSLIRNGIPAAGMPPFELPDNTERPVADTIQIGRMLYDIIFRGAGEGNRGPGWLSLR